MKSGKSKSLFLQISAILSLIAAFAISGCSNSSENSGPEHTEHNVYNGEVAYIGDLSGVLSDDIEAIFINSVPYDGSSADKPIFIDANSIQFLTAEQQKGILDSFLNNQPITLLQGGATEINALLDILGLEQNYFLPEGLPEDKQYAELFCVDQEADGDIFTWATYPPMDGEVQSTDAGEPPLEIYDDSDEDQFDRSELFLDWFKEDTSRDTAESDAYSEQAKKILKAGIEDDSSELTKISKEYSHTVNYTFHGNNYQITYFIYSCHSFNAADSVDYDWFYVRQEGLLNASGAYRGIYDDPNITGWQNNNVGYYADSYIMSNWMEGLTSGGSGVTLQQPKPENANNEETVTSGIVTNIGGKVGYAQGKGVSAELSAGVTITNSRTFKVKDCEVINNSGSQVNDATWKYEFKKATQNNHFIRAIMNEPTILSRTTFQPVNQWIWKFSPAIRDSDKNWFNSRFDASLVQTRVGALIIFGFFTDPINIKYSWSWQAPVPLPFPPLLVAPHNMEFTRAGQSRAIDLSVARSWTATSDQPWCRAEQTSGAEHNPHINITVDPNDTNASRTAYIRFATADGKGSDTMKVFQSQY